jgi:hypothetical protein
MALTADRNTAQAKGEILELPMKGSTEIFAGALVCLNASGLAVPGATATTLLAAGRAEEHVVNSGADSSVTISVRRGTFLFANSASTDAIAWTEYGKQVYVVDDQTVAKTNGSTTRSVAGICRGIDAATGGVWVQF